MAAGESAANGKQKIKRAYEAAIGEWPQLLDPVLDADPELATALVDFVRIPFERGNLTPKFRELVLIAVNASTTHLYEPGLRVHIRNALRLGATRDEIVEVYELASVLGIHTCTMGVPVLCEELAATGAEQVPDLDERRQAIKRTFIEERGGWTEFLEQMLIVDPELLEAYAAYSTVPWKKGHLTAKEKELIYIAIDAQPTHLYETGLRIHIRNALAHGATCGDIVDVFALISSVGFHTLTMGLPVLDAVLAEERPVED